MVGVGCSAPTSSTSSGGRPISSWASRSAVARRSRSPGSARPPGKEISPAWRRRSERRRVRTTCNASSSSRYSGTSTAASTRPCTSSAAASAESSRTPRSAAARSSSERDALDTLVEHDLAVERAMDRALGGDHAQPLDLLVAEGLGEAHHEAEAGGRPPLGRRVLGRDLNVADVPALACPVHLHRDRGAGREGGCQQVLRAGAGVLAALLGWLVYGQLVMADLDGLPEGAGADGTGLHGAPIMPEG